MDKTYLFNFVVFVVVLAGFLLAYQYWWVPRQEQEEELSSAEGLLEGLVIEGVTPEGEVIPLEGFQVEAEPILGEPEEAAPYLSKQTLVEGQGEAAKNGDNLKVHYTGRFTNGGPVFDSSIGGGVPFQFTLGAGQVIQGWDLGVLGMKVGEKRKLIIPSELAYGESGQGPIPPNTDLEFEIELLEIIK